MPKVESLVCRRSNQWFCVDMFRTDPTWMTKRKINGLSKGNNSLNFNDYITHSSISICYMTVFYSLQSFGTCYLSILPEFRGCPYFWGSVIIGFVVVAYYIPRETSKVALWFAWMLISCGRMKMSVVLEVFCTNIFMGKPVLTNLWMKSYRGYCPLGLPCLPYYDSVAMQDLV